MKRKKKGQNVQTAAETSDASKRQFWSGMIPLAAFGPLIPQSAVLTDPNGSQGWDVRQMRSHARVQRCEIVSFSPFLCLPVILKLNGLPKPPKTPPASLQRNAGRQHTAALSTQVIMWPKQPITAQRSQVSKSKYTFW